MTAVAAPLNDARPALLDIGPRLRGVVGVVGVGLTSICLLALARAVAGLAPDAPGAHHLAVIVHLATVLPAVPLGAWLLLARKGTPRHKLLGKIWVGLMATTAVAALFVREINQGGLSPIHLLVPLTLHGAWQTIASARRGDTAGHKRALVRFYLTALVIPAALTFLPGRLMNVWLLG